MNLEHFDLRPLLACRIVGPVMRRLLREARRHLTLRPQLEVDLNLTTRPNYAYCVYHAAELARRLSIKQISIIEFGVAGGNGLVFLDRFAKRVSLALGVDIEVYGFDTGTGLPAVRSKEDLPYWFESAQYRMDIPRLKKATSSSTLVLGDVKDTVGSFFARYNPAPVGAIMNDLDLHSSTSESLRVFDADPSHFLPRVFIYFDDIIGSEYEMYSECNGQLLAISEFNERHASIHISLNQNLLTRSDVSYRYQIYYAHLKSHSQYCTYVGGAQQQAIEGDLRLKSGSKAHLV